MKIHRSPHLKRFIPGIDATPMADIVFLLLIFFMLSSTFIIQPGLKIKLPSAVTSEVELTKNIVLNITEEGYIFLDDTPTNILELPSSLNAALSKQEEKVVIIKADESVRHGFIVKIMDVAKLSGAERLVIATEPTTEIK